MKRLMLALSMFAALALLFVACKKEEKADPGKTEPAKTEPAKTEPAKTEPAAGGNKIGIAICDEYLDKFEKCITTKMPEAARAGLKTGLDTTRNAWKSAAATEVGKKALENSCKITLETNKKANPTCDW
jgi:hypothetical protein